MDDETAAGDWARTHDDVRLQLLLDRQEDQIKGLLPKHFFMDPPLREGKEDSANEIEDRSHRPGRLFSHRTVRCIIQASFTPTSHVQVVRGP